MIPITDGGKGKRNVVVVVEKSVFRDSSRYASAP
jgi:hypothetical protein